MVPSRQFQTPNMGLPIPVDHCAKEERTLLLADLSPQELQEMDPCDFCSLSTPRKRERTPEMSPEDAEQWVREQPEVRQLEAGIKSPTFQALHSDIEVMQLEAEAKWLRAELQAARHHLLLLELKSADHIRCLEGFLANEKEAKWGRMKMTFKALHFPFASKDLFLERHVLQQGLLYTQELQELEKVANDEMERMLMRDADSPLSRSNSLSPSSRTTTKSQATLAGKQRSLGMPWRRSFTAEDDGSRRGRPEMTPSPPHQQWSETRDEEGGMYHKQGKAGKRLSRVKVLPREVQAEARTDERKPQSSNSLRRATANQENAGLPSGPTVTSQQPSNSNAEAETWDESGHGFPLRSSPHPLRSWGSKAQSTLRKIVSKMSRQSSSRSAPEWSTDSSPGMKSPSGEGSDVSDFSFRQLVRSLSNADRAVLKSQEREPQGKLEKRHSAQWKSPKVFFSGPPVGLETYNFGEFAGRPADLAEALVMCISAIYFRAAVGHGEVHDNSPRGVPCGSEAGPTTPSRKRFSFRTLSWRTTGAAEHSRPPSDPNASQLASEKEGRRFRAPRAGRLAGNASHHGVFSRQWSQETASPSHYSHSCKLPMGQQPMSGPILQQKQELHEDWPAGKGGELRKQSYHGMSGPQLLPSPPMLNPYGALDECRILRPEKYASMLELRTVPAGNKLLAEDHATLWRYGSLLEQLEVLDPEEMQGADEKLAFWINIYNAVVMHAYVMFGEPPTGCKRMFLSSKAMAVICGLPITALEIEYYILRSCSQRATLTKSSKLLKWKAGDRRRVWALSNGEPFVSFALCTGALSSPALRVYTSTGLRSELEAARCEYLAVSVGLKKDKLILPKLLDWYRQDFAADEAKLLHWVAKQLPQQQRAALELFLKEKARTNSEWSLEIAPYDWSFRYLLQPMELSSGPALSSDHCCSPPGSQRNLSSADAMQPLAAQQVPKSFRRFYSVPNLLGRPPPISQNTCKTSVSFSRHFLNCD